MALIWVRNVRDFLSGLRVFTPGPAHNTFSVGLSEGISTDEGLGSNFHNRDHFENLIEEIDFGESIFTAFTHAAGTSYSVSVAEEIDTLEDLFEERTPLPVVTCFDLTASPYSCIHDASTSPLAATLDHNRDAIQQCITDVINNGGGKICIPAGWNIPFSRATGHIYGVLIQNAGAGVPIVWSGDGATLRMVRYSGTSDFYGIQIIGTGRVIFQGLTFSQRGTTTGIEQQHMLQVGNASTPTDDVTFDRCRFIEGVGNLDSTGVTTKTLGGDAVRLLGSTTGTISRVQFDKCRFENCFRSAITCQRGVAKLKVTNCYFTGTGDQDIDMEPTSPGALIYYLITGNTMDRTAGGLIGVTLTGQGTTTDQLQHCIFAFNHMRGSSIYGLQMNNVLIHGNTVICDRADGGSSDAVIGLLRTTSNVTISHNYLHRQAVMIAAPVIDITENGSEVPRNIKIINNHILQETVKETILLDSVVDCDVSFNRIVTTLPAGTTGSGNGVSIQSSIGSSSGVISGNKVYGVGTALPVNGLKFDSSASFPLGKFFIRDNYIDSCTTAILFNGAAGAIARTPLIDGNSFSNVSNKIGSTTATVPPYTTGGNDGSEANYVYGATPLSIISAPIGSTCVNVATGDVYRKTSGTGSAGWVTP